MGDVNINVRKAAILHDDEIGYENQAGWRHGLAHIMATTLAHPDHLMDYEYAEKNMPKNRISGYEAEPMAAVYQAAIASYPKSWKESFEAHFRFLHNNSTIQINNTQSLLDYIIEMTKAFSTSDAQIIEKNSHSKIYLIFNKKEDYQLLDNSGKKLTENRKNHLKGRTIYAQNIENIRFPSIREIEFHMQKAEEFCKNFKEAHGKFPSEFADYQLSSMPLANFAIDHKFPEWLKQEWQEQQKNWKAAIKSSNSSNITHR